MGAAEGEEAGKSRLPRHHCRSLCRAWRYVVGYSPDIAPGWEAAMLIAAPKRPRAHLPGREEADRVKALEENGMVAVKVE